MIIAFLTPDINFRGTCRALYDYAAYNETLLGNKSIIVSDASCIHKNSEIAFKWISNRFPVLFYTDKTHLHSLLTSNQCDLLYCIKYGKDDHMHFKDIPTVVHCVFDMTQPHGAVYAGVSKSLAAKFYSNLYVPHMVSMKRGNDQNNMRCQLSIPSDAIVFGRYGGMDTFNLEFAKTIISRVARENSNIYFLFMNTPSWDNHSQIIHLEASTDISYKQRFICTCNAMIVPETLGHTFFMAGAEFALHQKPLIVYNGPVWNTAHIDQIGEKGIYFQSPEQLYDILTQFDPKEYQNRTDLNVFAEFTPESVMRKFKQVFIDPIVLSIPLS
jgi:hypothetical protein